MDDNEPRRELVTAGVYFRATITIKSTGYQLYFR